VGAVKSQPNIYEVAPPRALKGWAGGTMAISHELSSLGRILDVEERKLPAKEGSSIALIEDHGDDHPSHLVTYDQLRAWVSSAVSVTAGSAPWKAGDVVGLVAPNSVEFVVAFLAIVEAGAVVAPLNPAYTLDEFTFYLKDADAQAVVVLQVTESRQSGRKGSTQEEWKQHPAWHAAASLGISVVEIDIRPENGGDADWLVRREGRRASQSESPSLALTLSSQSIALFLHTSGTTSRPKGVPLSHINLITSVRNIAQTYDLSFRDKTCLVMPLFHVHGLMAGLLATLSTGGTVVLPPGGKFSASSFWGCITRHKVTWYTAVPTIHQILLGRKDKDYPSEHPPKLRFIRSCSAALAPAVLVEMEQCFHAPVLEAYAMTEASHQISSNPLPDKRPRVPGSVGIGQNVEVAIANDRGDFLDAGQEGEICIRGQNVMEGYKNNPEANSASFLAGWFRTGDQGTLDGAGYIRITGRIKEMINRGGEKISPLEVDAALLSHPHIAEAVSFGVPDVKYGEEINAAIVPSAGSKLSTKELKEFLAGRIAPFKIPKQFFFTEALPRTATGKIQRRKVAEHFHAMQ